MTAGDLDIVKSKLLDQIEAVCKWLLPEGKPEGDLWVSFNPVEHDYKPGRLPALKVRIRRGDIGAWKCWRCGVSGDVIKLIAYVLKTDTSGALKEARDFLGIQKMTRAEREQLRRVEAEKKVRRDEDAEKARLRKLQDADRLFNAAPSSKPIGPALVPHGTAAFGAGSDAELHAQHYFAARNVPIDQLFGRYTFRFSPATEWWKGQSWKNEGGRRWIDQRGPLFPAVHSAMRAWNGIVTCCHVTFLDPVKPDKAPVQPAKMVWGEAKGAVIEVSPGPSKIPFWMADREGLKPAPLIIAEGIETALSFAVTIPEARVWAGGSLAGVQNAPVHLDCVAWVLFARDNNAGNPQAQKQFDQALAGLEASGKAVTVEASHVGDDFNDLARGDDDDDR